MTSPVVLEDATAVREQLHQVGAYLQLYEDIVDVVIERIATNFSCRTVQGHLQLKNDILRTNMGVIGPMSFTQCYLQNPDRLESFIEIVYDTLQDFLVWLQKQYQRLYRHGESIMLKFQGNTAILQPL